VNVLADSLPAFSSPAAVEMVPGIRLDFSWAASSDREHQPKQSTDSPSRASWCRGWRAIRAGHCSSTPTCSGLADIAELWACVTSASRWQLVKHQARLRRQQKRFQGMPPDALRPQRTGSVVMLFQIAPLPGTQARPT